MRVDINIHILLIVRIRNIQLVILITIIARVKGSGIFFFFLTPHFEDTRYVTMKNA